MHGLQRCRGSRPAVERTVLRWRGRTGKVVFVLCLGLLMLALVACDDQGSVVTPPVAPASSPSQVLATPPPVATVTFQVYTGSAFSLHYPQDWVVRSAGAGVSLSDASGTYNLTVNFQPNAQGALTSAQLADAGLVSAKGALSNPQSVSIAATITLAGTTWSQRAITGTTLSNGVQVKREVIILATNHPAHAASTQGVILIYTGLAQSFTQARQTYFTPMLQTFAFA